MAAKCCDAFLVSSQARKSSPAYCRAVLAFSRAVDLLPESLDKKSLGQLVDTEVDYVDRKVSFSVPDPPRCAAIIVKLQGFRLNKLRPCRKACALRR